MVIYCGKCGKKLLPDDSAAGKIGVCAQCKAKLPIPKGDPKQKLLCLFCPECEGRIGAPMSQAGKETACPKCGAKVALAELEKKKKSDITGKIIDSGLLSLDDMEELRKIPLPPPPTRGRTEGEAADGAAAGARSEPWLAGALARTVIALVVAALVVIQVVREVRLNLQVSDAQRLAGEQKFREAVQILDGVMSEGAFTAAKRRAAKARPRYDELARAQDACTAALEFASANPDDLCGALDRWGAISKDFGNTPSAGLAAEQAKALEAKIASQAKPILAQLADQAEALMNQGKFTDALKAMDSFPEGLRSPKWLAELEALRRKTEGKAESIKKLIARGAVFRDGKWVSADRSAQLDQEAFEREQEKKGLVKVDGRWVTKEEKEKLDQERIAKGKSAQGMFLLYRDKWVPKEEADRIARRVRIESSLPKGCMAALTGALEKAGLTGSTDADKTECAFLLRARHEVVSELDPAKPDVGLVKVTLTVTFYRLSIGNPEEARDKLAIKEEELFSLQETGRKMTPVKGAVKTDSVAGAMAAMEVGAVNNALDFLEKKLPAKLREATGAEQETPKAAPHAPTEAALRSLRQAESDSARRKAEEALVRIGKDAVPRMIEALENPSSEVRLSVVRALGEIGDMSAVHALRQVEEKGAHREEGADVAAAAREAIRKILAKNK